MAFGEGIPLLNHHWIWGDLGVVRPSNEQTSADKSMYSSSKGRM